MDRRITRNGVFDGVINCRSCRDSTGSASSLRRGLQYAAAADGVFLRYPEPITGPPKPLVETGFRKTIAEHPEAVFIEHSPIDGIPRRWHPPSATHRLSRRHRLIGMREQ